MRIYCLYCFAELEEPQEECVSCGRVSSKADRRIYWNRCPRLIRMQRGIVVVSLIGAVVLSFALVSAGTGTAGGTLVALPIGAYVAVSQTAEKLTKHAPYFRPSVFWPLLFVAGGMLLTLFIHGAFLLLCFLAVPAHHMCGNGQKWKEKLRRG